MRQLALLVTLVVSMVLLQACGRMPNEEIMQSRWKFGEGYHMGDMLVFERDHLRGDTIFEDGEARALIMYCGKEVM